MWYFCLQNQWCLTHPMRVSWTCEIKLLMKSKYAVVFHWNVFHWNLRFTEREKLWNQKVWELVIVRQMGNHNQIHQQSCEIVIPRLPKDNCLVSLTAYITVTGMLAVCQSKIGSPGKIVWTVESSKYYTVQCLLIFSPKKYDLKGAGGWLHNDCLELW